MGMSGGSFCPNCGNQRAGNFRYCQKCGHDFEAAAAPPPVTANAGPGWSPPPSGRAGRSGIAEKLVIIAIVAAVAIGGLVIWSNMQVNEILSDVGDAIATPRATRTEAPPIPPSVADAGSITFGDGIDPDSLEIVEPSGRFGTARPEISWSAILAEPAGATALTWVMARVSAGGAETLLWTEEMSVTNPDFDTFANTMDLAGLAGNEEGTYVIRILRDTAILAEGTFVLV